MYADDCTIFLEPTDRNLRNALETLNSFFKISGLKISVTKTKAIWFGKGFPNDQRLCPDLTLDWVSQFRLLGVDFDSNLENMECNFDSKIKDIEKLLNCWIYRTLTVYGKAVIIKTLALSKLSHLALVLPNLDKRRLKTVETLFYNFLWGNKTDKVTRNDTKLNEKAGGLGIVDINSFWLSLKISWIRRILNTNAFWPVILKLTVENVLDYNISMMEILQLGPNMLNFIGKKLKNEFWKGVFCSIRFYMQGALFCYPENISQSPIWDNPIFLKSNKPIKKTSFPTIASKVNTISDFYKPGTSCTLSKTEFENKYNVIITDETLLQFHYIFRMARGTLGLGRESTTFYPTQPLLINIANLTKKGCNVYTRLISKKSNLQRNHSDREQKWHRELDCTFGTVFWDKCYSLTASIKNENRMKWLQFQINRNCLFTNYKVNKFKPAISPACSFCSHLEEPPPPEITSHLFFECDFVLQLWQDVHGWLATFNINLPLNRTQLLFGIHEQSSNSVENFIIFFTKYYIWKTKFTTKTLLIDSFKHFLKYKLDDLKDACVFENREDKFRIWRNIYDELLE